MQCISVAPCLCLGREGLTMYLSYFSAANWLIIMRKPDRMKISRVSEAKYKRQWDIFAFFFASCISIYIISIPYFYIVSISHVLDGRNYNLSTSVVRWTHSQILHIKLNNRLAQSSKKVPPAQFDCLWGLGTNFIVKLCGKWCLQRTYCKHSIHAHVARRT